MSSSRFPALARGGPLLAAALLCTLFAGCRSEAPPSTASVPADTWAVVDGRSITRQDVDQAYNRTTNPGQTASDEELLTAKLALLNDLIVQDLLIAKAGQLKIEVPANELENAYNEARKNIPNTTFEEELKRRNLTADDMREGLRRELLTQKVIEQEVGSKITVTDQEITDFFNANRARFNLAEEAYHIAQIAITPVAEPQAVNRLGDDATTPQTAQAKAQMIMQRLKEGASFQDLALDYSEDPESAPRGGDLGFVPVSRLKQAPPQLRDAVIGKAPGSVTVVSDSGAHTIVLVVAHEPAGQRDLSTPGVRDNITQTLRTRREQLLRAAYLTALRTDAEIVNYLARRIVQGQGELPAP